MHPSDMTRIQQVIDNPKIIAGDRQHAAIRISPVWVVEILNLENTDKLNLLNFKDISIESRKGKFNLKAKAKFKDVKIMPTN